MSDDANKPMSAARRTDIGKAVWAFNRLLDEVPIAGKYDGRPSEETLNNIAAYGSIIERAAERQREREEAARQAKERPPNGPCGPSRAIERTTMGHEQNPTTEPPERMADYGQMAVLRDAVLRKYPKIKAECRCTPPGAQLGVESPNQLRVSHQLRGPWLIESDGCEYVWIDGPRAGGALGELHEVETSADNVAAVLEAETAGEAT